MKMVRIIKLYVYTQHRFTFFLLPQSVPCSRLECLSLSLCLAED
jgi:hypothetical protein